MIAITTTILRNLNVSSIILKMPTFRILFLLLLVCLSCILNIANAQSQPSIRNGTIIRPGSTLSPTNNSYWVSNSGQFAFGFYPNGNGFSVGIWLENIESKTVVWTANRDDPPYPADAKLLLGTDGRLVVQLEQGKQTTSSASMLDSGNFVLFDSSSNIIWQSFDSPTATIVAGQRLLVGQRLVSDVSETDHATGKFQLVMQRDGNLVAYSIESTIMEASYWSSDTQTAGDNVTLNLDGNGQLYLLNSTAFNVKTIADNAGVSDKQIYRTTFDADGIFRLYSHSLNQPAANWSIQWSSSSNRCDSKGVCGMNSYCTLMNWEPQCQCLPGFDYIDRAHKDLGCNKNYTTTIDTCKANSVQTFNFSELLGLSWLDNSYSTLSSISKDDCREECFKDCNCEAAIYDNQQCKKLRLPLKFGKKDFASQATTILKVDAAPITGGEGKRKQRNLRSELLITSIALACVIVASAITVAVVVLKNKYRVRGYRWSTLSEGSNGFAEHISLRSFSFEELKDASNNFTDEIGKGSCGTVFKGIILVNSNTPQTVAIKRLEKVLAAGEREFKNEMTIIAKTHHRNLVQLLCYCQDGTSMLLVYEYMSNGSLADFFFNAKLKTDWEGRTETALDIARGILYLHEECETQIIHCDIKPENILMDDNGCAKIADFGLAKLLMPNQTKTFTGIRGTRGYVAPEWWHQNTPITVKADVYSFGIMFLEIICCRRSIDMNASEDEVVLPYWVYDCFMAGELEKVVKLDEAVEMKMVERMVKVGLWCIQDDPSLSPSIKKVVLMLEGTVDIPPPPLRPTSFTTSPYIVIGSSGSA